MTGSTKGLSRAEARDTYAHAKGIAELETDRASAIVRMQIADPNNNHTLPKDHTDGQVEMARVIVRNRLIMRLKRGVAAVFIAGSAVAGEAVVEAHQVVTNTQSNSSLSGEFLPAPGGGLGVQMSAPGSGYGGFQVYALNGSGYDNPNGLTGDFHIYGPQGQDLGVQHWSPGSPVVVTSGNETLTLTNVNISNGSGISQMVLSWKVDSTHLAHPVLAAHVNDILGAGIALAVIGVTMFWNSIQNYRYEREMLKALSDSE